MEKLELPKYSAHALENDISHHNYNCKNFDVNYETMQGASIIYTTHPTFITKCREHAHYFQGYVVLIMLRQRHCMTHRGLVLLLNIIIMLR